VYHTLESSGRPVSSYFDSNTGVYVADTELDYFRHADSFSTVLFTGNLSATIAGRVSRHFKFRGPSMMIDTACSSSLVAVHTACRELLMGDVNTAIVASASLRLFPQTTNPEIDLNISSGDGKTCSFSSDANGSGTG